ncbi:MAG TPA: peptidyl-prolyl cis-trans isomerase [Candidatus Saccharimonadales bacterium]|jgi:parvulin-like peptidyl-prolyl isomerase|nr:peptidyl-prolyl cis-trans isomerase [Candidatus Saccharimonadales bacterium]
MKWFSIFAAGTSVLWVLAARAELVSGISVVVNDSVITYAEIEDEVVKGAATAARVYANNPQAYDQEVERLRSQDIELLVEDKLILHEFATSPYTTNVLEAFIDDRIRDKIQKEYYGDRTRLIKTLDAEGITYEAFRRQQRDQFIIEYETYQNNSNLRKILISPLKIEQYYNGHKDDFKVDDQVHLRMIVVNQQPDSPTGMARRVAEEIMAKIDSGVPFAEMASVYSSGSQRAEGGDRGWVERSYFKPELADKAFSLKPGQHSGVIDLPEACYLMMVEDVRPAHVRPLTEVRDEVERTLRSEESLRLRKTWIERLKRKSFIEYY